MGLKHLKAILFAFFIFLPQVVSAVGWQWMTPQRAYNLVKEGSGLWLVDVRSEAAFEEGHIEGAVHIPAGVLATRRLPKGKIFVLVDDGLGLRKGREAADFLLKNGQEKIYLLDGGMAAWQGEGYPMAGKSVGRAFGSVMPDELKWAQENRIPLKIFDLRDADERKQGEVPQALALEGAALPERLQKAKGLLTPQKKGLAGKLDKPATIVLVFPTGVDPRPLLEQSFRDIPGDVRYLEGGYAAWGARPEKRISTTQGGCPTCPGAVVGGGPK
ncbi:MAG: hypothetical protein HYS23_10830 [Geobacter sp.]|nr:hypothetical protein [Geobacter sp.]